MYVLVWLILNQQIDGSVKFESYREEFPDFAACVSRLAEKDAELMARELDEPMLSHTIRCEESE